MKTEDRQRIKDIFVRVAAASPAERPALLDEACGDDAALRAEVESLLAHDSEAGESFLVSPLSSLRTRKAVADWAANFIGRQIGRYTITRLIGRGGMGCIFEAQQEQPARSVALKVLQPGFSAPTTLARFRLEPEVLGRLQHPNIAQVYEAGIHEDQRGSVPYFAMELIPGAQPLIAFAEEHQLTTRQRLELFAKVCDAVQHGHQKGIIHRDLKPANILVGQDGEPKVIDFGVARSTDADILITTQQTNVGDLIGTVHYMSPEQCDGDSGDIDTRSDVYSLGVVLFELLTGLAPYKKTTTTVYATICMIKDSPVRRLSEANRRFRGNLDAILLKALEKDPQRRYSSAADLAQDIRRHVAGEPIEARTPTPWQRALYWAGRHPQMTGIANVLLVAALAALGVYVTMEAYIDYTLGKPYRMVRLEDGKWIEVISRQQIPLAHWTTDDGAISNARLLKLDPYEEGPTHALLAYDSHCEADLKGRLCLYDLYADNPEIAVASWRVQAEHLPNRPEFRDQKPASFAPQLLWLLDVFPDYGNPGQPEVVCAIASNHNSLRALCIFGVGEESAELELLYSFWHDGGLFDCYWLADSEVLVVAAENWENAVRRDVCPQNFSSDHPAPIMVLFAVQPEQYKTAARMLTPATPDRETDLLWYKRFRACPERGVFWTLKLRKPRERDPRTELGVALTIEGDDEISYEYGWLMDAKGETIPGTVSDYYYLRGLGSHEWLPPVEDLDLVDILPPANRTADD